MLIRRAATLQRRRIANSCATSTNLQPLADIPSAAVNNIEKRLLVVQDSAARASSPSSLSQPKRFCKLDESKFAFHRPPKPNILPLALLHPIFAEFVANVEHHEPTPEDNALVVELCEVLSKPGATEVQQSELFRTALGKHYHIQLYSASVGSTTRTSDGHAAFGDYLYAVFEMKGWNGKGDPEIQASLYALEAMRPVIKNRKDAFDLLPCIIVYCVGGWLSLQGNPLLTPHRLPNWVFWDGHH